MTLWGTGWMLEYAVLLDPLRSVQFRCITYFPGVQCVGTMDATNDIERVYLLACSPWCVIISIIIIIYLLRTTSSVSQFEQHFQYFMMCAWGTLLEMLFKLWCVYGEHCCELKEPSSRRQSFLRPSFQVIVWYPWNTIRRFWDLLNLNPKKQGKKTRALISRLAFWTLSKPPYLARRSRKNIKLILKQPWSTFFEEPD